MSNSPTSNPKSAENHFFEHFATLATAPDGIAKLRELILQLAVQGKLGTQDAGDELASVAVDVFFRKNKHIKKKHFVNIDENSRLPDRWISITLGDIGQWALGTGFPISIQGNTDKPILFCKVSDMNLPGNEKWIKTTNHTIDEEIKNQYNIKTHSKGTVIFPKIGGAIATNKRRIITRSTAIDNNCLGITPNDFCSTDWLFLILTSIDFTQYQSGTSMPALNQGTLAEIVTSLPPLAEQHRIVAKVNRLMALCDDLEARQKHERVGCLKLGTASLAGLQNAESREEFGQKWAGVCDAFDLILDCPENVAVLRQTILQLAVQGRMVRQDIQDEPVEKLVVKIQKEHLGNAKPKEQINPVDDEDAPFPIPSNWKWYKISDIFNTSSGSTPLRTKLEYFIDGTESWVKTTDLNNGLVLSCQELITKNAVKEYNLKYYPIGTVCIAMYGGAGTIGKSGILGMETTINQSVFGIFPSPYINSKFLHLYVKSIRAEWMKHAMGLRKAPNINGIIIKRMPFPLPPLAEQHRIVAKVDVLMALCDALESRIKERAGVQRKMAGAVVKGVAGGV